MHRSTGKRLNKIISDGLWAGCGDTDWNGMNSSAIAYKILRDNELKIDSEKVVTEMLSGQNAWGINFLDENDN
jgi:hypothetical protein